jgi:hypothetical protein
MSQPVSRRTFLGASGLAAVAAAIPALPPAVSRRGAAHDGKDGALRDTAYLYQRPA